MHGLVPLLASAHGALTTSAAAPGMLASARTSCRLVWPLGTPTSQRTSRIVGQTLQDGPSAVSMRASNCPCPTRRTPLYLSVQGQTCSWGVRTAVNFRHAGVPAGVHSLRWTLLVCQALSSHAGGPRCASALPVLQSSSRHASQRSPQHSRFFWKEPSSTPRTHLEVRRSASWESLRIAPTSCSSLWACRMGMTRS